MYVSETERMKSGEYERPKCPESHYWFDFWLRRGWRVKCTACGKTAHPGYPSIGEHAEPRTPPL